MLSPRERIIQTAVHYSVCTTTLLVVVLHHLIFNSTLWHKVFPDTGSLFEYTPGRLVADAAKPTVFAKLPGPTLGAPKLDKVAAMPVRVAPPRSGAEANLFGR